MTKTAKIITGVLVTGIVIGGFFWWYKKKKSTASPIEQLNAPQNNQLGNTPSSSAPTPVTPGSPDEAQISTWINKIKADPAWLSSVQDKAKKNGISLDDQLRADAIWMMNQK